MFCTRCGQQNPADALYCARCGTALVRPGGPVAAPAPAAPEGPAERTSTISLSGLGADSGEHEPPGATAVVADGDLAAVDGLPPGSALLVVKRGPNAGSRFLLDQDTTTAGRHPESDIFLDDVTVSRRHAEFHRGAGGFRVRDVGSLNGTYLNRERIDDTELAGGDEVQIGKFRLLFLLAPPPGAPAAPAAAGSQP